MTCRAWAVGKGSGMLSPMLTQVRGQHLRCEHRQQVWAVAPRCCYESARGGSVLDVKVGEGGGVVDLNTCDRGLGSTQGQCH